MKSSKFSEKKRNKINWQQETVVIRCKSFVNDTMEAVKGKICCCYFLLSTNLLFPPDTDTYKYIQMKIQVKIQNQICYKYKQIEYHLQDKVRWKRFLLSGLFAFNYLGSFKTIESVKHVSKQIYYKSTEIEKSSHCNGETHFPGFQEQIIK